MSGMAKIFCRKLGSAPEVFFGAFFTTFFTTFLATFFGAFFATFLAAFFGLDLELPLNCGTQGSTQIRHRRHVLAYVSGSDMVGAQSVCRARGDGSATVGSVVWPMWLTIDTADGETADRWTAAEAGIGATTHAEAQATQSASTRERIILDS